MTLLLWSRIDNEWSDYDFEKRLQLVPYTHREKVIKFRFWKDRQRCLIGKMQLLHGLRNWYNHKTSLEDLRYTAYGRPFLESGPDFSISHSGDYVICALDDNARVGVDIEEIRPVTLDDFQSQFHSAEWSIIQSSGAKYHAFYRFWTRKEAVIKADGRGINLPLDQIVVTQAVTYVDYCSWWLTSIDLDSQYCLSIARNCDGARSINSIFFPANSELPIT
jgi:4'-phosphopantetheinyl transferase